MKKSLRLIRLASILSHKYASINAESIRPEVEAAIKTAIINASTQSSSGLIPFTQMAAQDQTVINFYILRDGRNIKVYDLQLDPANSVLLSKYQPLLNQVQEYLTKNWELYPTKRDGEDISYDAFLIHFVYPDVSWS
jgi:di/tripeptidase